MNKATKIKYTVGAILLGIMVLSGIIASTQSEETPTKTQSAPQGW